MNASERGASRMKRLRIGLIGCGKIARCSHAPEFMKLKGKAVIAGLFDPDRRSIELLRKESGSGAKAFSSAEELLASGLDGVVIGTPNSSHCELTMQSLEAGVNVLVEKPMATTLKEADGMIDLAARKGLVLQVNQSFRFAPAYLRIKELIDAGRIGEPVHIRCIRASSDSPDKLWSPGAEWFVQRKFAGGVIMDIAVHMADMLSWHFGKVEKVYATNSARVEGRDVPDNSNAVFNFENGATGVLELSWTLPSGASLLEIYGSKGMIRAGFNPEGPELSVTPGKFKLIKAGRAKSSQEAFVDAINGKSATPVPGELGRQALALCLAIAKSGDTGRAVEIT